ncbi:MAG: hypothetical protein PF693_00060 [Spirochaetia bacterium]|jgi:hypothetical protein|nr:hypothetical protein [Spirochaetia bacterium]
MSLFLLFSVPLFSGIMISHYFKWEFNTERFKKLFFSGLFFYLIARIILLLIGIFYNIYYDKLSLFLYLWINEIVVVLLVALAGYFLMLKKDLFRQNSYKEYPFMFSYISGFFILSGLTKIIGNFFNFDSYILFIYPFISIILLVFFSIIIIEASTKRGYISVLIYSLLIPVSLLLALVPWFYYLNYTLISIGILLASLVGIGVVFFILKKDYNLNN